MNSPKNKIISAIAVVAIGLGFCETTSQAFQINIETDEDNMYMLDYLLASFNACRPINLSGQTLNELIDYSAVLKLTDANSWSQLKGLLTNNIITDLHYFGHGSRTGIGKYLSDPTVSISLAELKNSIRQKFPMTCVGLDGCHSAGGFFFWQTRIY